LGSLLDKFVYLKHTLAAILVFVGIKMGLSKVYAFDPLVSLGVIAVALTVGVVVSAVAARSKRKFHEGAFMYG
jgi:tellurite resistance protein TerC